MTKYEMVRMPRFHITSAPDGDFVTKANMGWCQN